MIVVPDSIAQGLIGDNKATIDVHYRDGQFRSDLKKPRDYKRDSTQNRNPSLCVSTCIKQRKMKCHSSDHLFQSW
jgi:hypothetical protein